MTPKEKAKELFNKMYFSEDQDGFHSMNKYRAKQCALIAVDEILKSLSQVKWIDEESIDFTPFFDYWREVKSEIEKL
jgi:hypothetical protein